VYGRTSNNYVTSWYDREKSEASAESWDPPHYQIDQHIGYGARRRHRRGPLDRFIDNDSSTQTSTAPHQGNHYCRGKTSRQCTINTKTQAIALGTPQNRVTTETWKPIQTTLITREAVSNPHRTITDTHTPCRQTTHNHHGGGQVSRQDQRTPNNAGQSTSV
jgi:hypothetical protein